MLNSGGGGGAPPFSAVLAAAALLPSARLLTCPAHPALLLSWVNDQKLVTFEGNRPEVVTELQVRGAQVTGRFVPVYGASQRSTYAHIRSVENDLDYENPVYPYRKYTADKWVSVNQTTHFGMR